MDEQKKEITMAVAAKIRYYRHKNSLSQEELALKANLNPAYFGQVERGLKCPTIDTLNKIALALDVSLSELVRSDSPANAEDHLDRFKDLLIKVPPNRINQVFSIFEGIIDLL